MPTEASIAADLRSLGCPEAGTLLVHASLASMGAVPGGAPTVVRALLAALGPDGTLVVPSFTAGNSLTSPMYVSRTRGMTDRQLRAYHDTMEPFRTLSTPSQGMGQDCRGGALYTGGPTQRPSTDLTFRRAGFRALRGIELGIEGQSRIEVVPCSCAVAPAEFESAQLQLDPRGTGTVPYVLADPLCPPESTGRRDQLALRGEEPSAGRTAHLDWVKVPPSSVKCAGPQPVPENDQGAVSDLL